MSDITSECQQVGNGFRITSSCSATKIVHRRVMLYPNYIYHEDNEDWLQSRLQEVDWDVKRELVNILDNQHDLWKDLFAVLPTWLQSRISIPQLQSVSCPAWGLIQKMEQWGFTVAQLIVCLETLNLEHALMIIKPDVELEIIQDVEEYLEIELGETLSLTCHATGFPTPYYQWYKDDRELLQYQSSTLMLEDAQLKDSGRYHCKVYTVDRLTNNERPNPLSSRTCKVIVSEPIVPSPATNQPGRPPVIVLQPRSPGENLPHGLTFVLECRATGDEPISYQWFKDTQFLPDECQSQLHLRYLLPDEDTGICSWKYFCLVTNRHGTIVSDIVTVGLSSSLEDTLFTAKDKVALLIANEHYEQMESFTLPSSDVATLSSILRDLGFRVMSYLDLTLTEMNNAVHHFCSELREGVYAFFYFAGHGFADQGMNFMQPVDASNRCIFEENLCVDAVATRTQKHSPALTFLLMDMCRERPDYESNPEIERKPARIYQQKKYKNAIFGYATSFLGEAVEVEGSPNGLFVKYLKRHLPERKKVCDILWGAMQDMRNDPLARREGQEPSVSYNISEARTLTDPILFERPEKALYEMKWQEIYRCPDRQDFKLGPFRFVVTFTPHKNTFCNALDMEVHYKDLSGTARNWPISVVLDFRPRSVIVDKMPVTEPEYVKFTLRGLQLLRNEQVTYTVKLKTGELFEVFSIAHSFTLPGLAKLGLNMNMLNEALDP